MVEGAQMCDEDIPLCPCTLIDQPKRLISWPEAKRIYMRERRYGDQEFHINALVHFYVDDQKFDGIFSGIWQRPNRALSILKHFDGIITPDYSICQDFPKPIKLFNIYRMRSFGYWISTKGLQVINNARWGSTETWSYCNNGIPSGSPIFVGAVASGLKKNADRPLFDIGFANTVEHLKPSAIYFYGSPTKTSVALLKTLNIPFKVFESDTCAAHKKKGGKYE